MVDGHKLTFDLPYLSVRALPEVDLPPISIITGVNGSGKTHLLKAIEAGHVKTTAAPTPATASSHSPTAPGDGEVRFFDWTTLVPNDAGRASSHTQYQQRDSILRYFEDARRQHQSTLVAALESLGLSTNAGIDPWDAARLSVDQLKARLGDDVDVQAISTKARELCRGFSRKLNRNPMPHGRILNYIERENGEHYPVLTRREDLDRYPFVWNAVDQFQQSFADLFLRYFELQKINRLRRIDEQEGRA